MPERKWRAPDFWSFGARFGLEDREIRRPESSASWLKPPAARCGDIRFTDSPVTIAGTGIPGVRCPGNTVPSTSDRSVPASEGPTRQQVVKMQAPPDSRDSGFRSRLTAIPRRRDDTVGEDYIIRLMMRCACSLVTPSFRCARGPPSSKTPSRLWREGANFWKKQPM